MAKFRKKPVVVEAVRWSRGVEIEGVIEGRAGNPAVLLAQHPDIPADIAQTVCAKAGGKRLGLIRTLEGWHIVTEGDWVITGVRGEKYACKPDIFAETYEPAASPPDAET